MHLNNCIYLNARMQGHTPSSGSVVDLLWEKNLVKTITDK